MDLDDAGVDAPTPAGGTGVNPELMYQEMMDVDDPAELLDHYSPEELDELQRYLDENDGEPPAVTTVGLSEVLDNCLLPATKQAFTTVWLVLTLCLVTKLASNLPFHRLFHEGPLRRQFIHMVSGCCGLVALHSFFETNSLFIVVLGVLVYFKCPGLSGPSAAIITLVYLLTCELFVVSSTNWLKIRGAQMILAMKVISLAFDLDGGLSMPGLLEYLGYIFNVGSVIFGPWLSYSEYASSYQRPQRMTGVWLARLARCVLQAMTAMLISTCMVHWLLLPGTWRAVAAYRDAASFRYSHFFVCYLSELTMALSGAGYTKSNGDVRWDFTVVRALHVELPRSLVEVVSNWNLPMHYWLKTYVFRPARRFGAVCAVLLTYCSSALLHGLNFQLAAVLLSLGVYSYIEHGFRRVLSKMFDACIMAKRCRQDCSHHYKAKHKYVIACNLLFGLLSVFHLAYLGLMFDRSAEESQGYTMSHTLKKWSELNFVSHWVALGTLVFYILI